MYFSSIFSKRIKAIRNAYSLSIAELSDILNLKSKSNVYNWENNRSLPSIEMLDDLVMLFGVSSDWLLGYVDTPYDENVLAKIEEFILNESYDNNGTRISLVGRRGWIPAEYRDPALRSQNYSLQVRANIVYCLHIEMAYTRANFINTLNQNGTIVLEDQSKKPYFYRILFDLETFEKKEKQRAAAIKNVKLLLEQKSLAEPIFNLEIQKTVED